MVFPGASSAFLLTAGVERAARSPYSWNNSTDARVWPSLHVHQRCPNVSSLQGPNAGHESAEAPLAPSPSFILSGPMPAIEREETHARTELGAGQKDTARELGAKLSSLKGIVWVGVGLFVFGLASLVWPPLKVIVGSVITSAALMLGGVALIVLPSLVVGNELLILGGAGLAVGAWFVAHRHGQLPGLVTASINAPGGRASLQAQTSEALGSSPSGS